MNNWNLKSASSISKSDFDLFNKYFPDKILYFDDLIETIKYLSTSVILLAFCYLNFSTTFLVYKLQ